MKILLVNTNRCRSPFPVLPAGACLVADAARGAGHRVTFLDLMFAREPMHALAAKIEEARPDVVGLSVRNIDNNDMLNPGEFVTELRALADAIRRRSDAPIVLGGPALPIMPEALLRHTGARCAVLGDGERVFPRLVERLGRGDTNGAVGDVAWLDGDRFRRARANGRGGFGAFRVPNLRRWVDLRPYISRYSPVPVRTKLGCRFECIHCTYPAIEGKAYRLADPEAVAEGVGSLVSCGLRDIEFVDNVFNYPYDHALAVCERIARLRRRARLQTVELHPRYVDDPLLEAMERAGFVSMGITVESASDRVLERLRKGFTARDVAAAAEVVRRHRLPCLWIFMLGGPGETEETVRESLRFAQRCIRPSDVALFTVGIRIYPGTELERIARAEDVLTEPPETMLRPAFYLAPGLDCGWLVRELRRAVSKRLNHLSSESCQADVLPGLLRLAYRLGVAPPLWRHTRLLRRALRLVGKDV